jgi:hypothetical protein
MLYTYFDLRVHTLPVGRFEPGGLVRFPLGVGAPGVVFLVKKPVNGPLCRSACVARCLLWRTGEHHGHGGTLCGR